MLIYDAVITGSFSYNGVNISDVTGSEASINALNQFTSSYNTGSFTGSFIGNGSGLLGVVSASFASNATSASQAQNAVSASFALNATSASQAQNAISSSFATNASSSNLLDGKDSTEFAITGSNIFTGTQYTTDTINPNGFGASASVYTDGGLRVTKDAYVSGTMYVNNLTVFGTQSINYVTSSQLNISTNIISVNTDTPSIRFGGLAVYDSGSTGLTGSMLWDSERDHWVYSNPSGSSYSGGMIMSGPRSAALGSEQGTLNNFVMKGQGGDHITSSQIIDDGTTVRIPGALQVTGSVIITSTLTGSSATFNGDLTLSSGGDRIFSINDTGGNLFQIQAAGNILYYSARTTGGSLAFRTNGTNDVKLSIASTGAATFSSFVGINGSPGTGFPLEAYINSSTAYTTSSRGNVMRLYNSNTSANIFAGIELGGAGTANDGLAGLNAVVTGSGSGALTFYTRDSNTFAERLRITSGGNVLIGTTTDAGYKLDVSGTTIFRNTSIVTSGGGYGAGLIIQNTTTSANNFSVLTLQANTDGYPIIEFKEGTNQKWQIFNDYDNDSLNFYKWVGTASTVLSLASTGTATFSNRVVVSNNAAGAATVSTNNANSSDDAGMSNLNFDGNRLRLGVLPSDSAYGCIGTNGGSTGLAFVTHNGSSFGERMRITLGGFTKMTSTTSYASSGAYHEMRANTAGNWVTYITNIATSDPYGIAVDYQGSSPNSTVNEFFFARDTGGTRFGVRGNGGIANYSSNNIPLSDERLKKDITSLESVWDKIKNIEIVKYKFKDQTHDDFNMGVIAQQVQIIAPELVDDEGWGTFAEDGTAYKGIWETDLNYYSIKALQEAMAKIEKLEAEINELKNK